MDSTQQKDTLRKRIEVAWLSTPYPGDSNIVVESERPRLKNGLINKDELDLKETLKGKSWQQAVPLLFQNNFASTMIFLSPQAFRYYMASYLTRLLDVGPYEENIVASAFEDRLRPSWAGYSSGIAGLDFLTYFDPLNSDQKEVVRDVLQHLSEELQAHSPVDGYAVVEAENNEFEYWHDPDGVARRLRAQTGKD